MKIGIVGAGLVGSTCAYSLVMRGIGREIVLVDADKKRSEAQANDIFHAVPFAHPLKVVSGEYSDLSGCHVVIMAAGVSQKPGEPRIGLLGRNASVFEKVIPQILLYAPNAIIVVATNPVDIMTHIAAYYAHKAGLPSTRVIGSGTTLDTARFRTLLGTHLGVDPQHIHGYVIGEHGQTEVLAWSAVRVGGMSLDNFCRDQNCSLHDEVKLDIDEKVRNAAFHIIEGKGATYYGIGSALARIVDVIIHDQRAILTVCTKKTEVEGIPDITLSLPHILGGNGIIATLAIPLCNEERNLLTASARSIRDTLSGLKMPIT
ncbi:MAG: L-lactate dehydrogenase [Deltaproteobacteria bacterium]|nr:L-lactate dehydrogenase [Deltaproteobacteria bacterium]